MSLSRNSEGAIGEFFLAASFDAAMLENREAEVCQGDEERGENDDYRTDKNIDRRI